MDKATKRENKLGLLAVLAIVKVFEKRWPIMIDSGTSANYARRRFLKECHQYAEALKPHEGDIITVRLASGVRVDRTYRSVELDVKF